MRHISASAVALATAAALSTTMLIGSPGAVGAPDSGADRAGKARFVDFALKGSGFGSRAKGGDVPSGSDQTAFMAVGCATRVGIDKENHEAEATMPGLGKASDVKTEIWTRQVDGVVSTFTRNSINKLVIAQSGMGRLQIKSITAFAHAFHDGTRFRSDAVTSVGSIEYVPADGGEPQQFDAPSPGQPIEIPGLATIALGTTKKRANEDGAKAQANALVITKTASGTRSSVAQAKAQVLDGVKHGTFHGFSAGSQSRGLDGNVTSGRSPLSMMPCQGTDGEVLTKRISDSSLDGNALAQGLQTQQMAKQLPGKSVAWERGSVTHFGLGAGQLDIDGIIGQANVTRDGNKVLTSIKGTTVGTVTANGEEQEFPDTDVLEIPGVAKIERFLVEETDHGISVIAVRVTMLDGTGAVYDLGQARMAIRRH